MMHSFERKHPAFVLGMYETGLAVARSLARHGISVSGFDHKKDVGFFSRYTNAELCPHPLFKSEEFVEFLLRRAHDFNNTPVLFITSDEFLQAVMIHRERLAQSFLFNMSPNALLNAITDKYQQFLLARNAGIPVPKTWLVTSTEDLQRFQDELVFPLFIKAQDVNAWRDRVSQKQKGFVIVSADDLYPVVEPILQKQVHLILQEIIQGTDENHCKFCSYFSAKGEMLLAFTLKKIRQFPIHYGVGSSVESQVVPELAALGEKFFRAIQYRGVGSAEFKYDDKDGQLKLIELNPRYWQQNALADRCGQNFPLVNYLDVTGQTVAPRTDFIAGIKWVNLYMDFASFLDYRREGAISWREWRSSLRGKKIYSDLARDDRRVIFYSSGYAVKLIKRFAAAVRESVTRREKHFESLLLRLLTSRVKKTWSASDRIKVLIQTNPYFTAKSWQEQILEMLGNDAANLEILYTNSQLEFIKLFPQSQICFCTHLSRHVELSPEQDRFIYIATSGLDTLRHQRIPAKTTIYNQHGIAGEAIADYCLMTSLMLLRNFPRAVLLQRKKHWDPAPLLTYESLQQRKVAILGVGQNGRAVARRFHALGCEILGCDSAPEKSCREIDRWFDPAELDEMIQAADILIITLPLTEQTRGLIDAARLALLGRNGLLINVGRGEIVREKDLHHALKNHIIAGAAVDTFAQEPLPRGSGLWNLPNLIISPHIAGNIHLFVSEIQADFVHQMRDQLAGRFSAQIKSRES